MTFNEVRFVFSVCEVGEWGDWAECATRCGGRRTRSRSLCCAQTGDLSFDDMKQCLKDCGRTMNQLTEVEPCLCVFGTSSGGGCVCEEHGWGNCCQYSECVVITVSTESVCCYCCQYSECVVIAVSTVSVLLLLSVQ